MRYFHNYCWHSSWSSDYCFRNILACYNYPACWCFWSYLDSFTSLTTDCGLANFFTITINVRYLTCLIVCSVSNSNLTILIITSYFHLLNLSRSCCVSSKGKWSKASEDIFTIYCSPRTFTIYNNLTSN